MPKTCQKNSENSYGFVANGLASVGMTGYFDATNTLNISGQDYANALIFGGLVGGGVEFSNWYFYQHIATQNHFLR